MLNIIGERMREARLDKGMMQKYLGEKAGISRNQICCYENEDERRRKYPSLFTLICIADVLDVSLDWLTGRTDKKEVNR